MTTTLGEVFAALNLTWPDAVFWSVFTVCGTGLLFAIGVWIDETFF